MRRSFGTQAVAIVLWAVLAVLAQNRGLGATFYIDPENGDNTRDGLSSASAKRDWSALKIASGNTYLQKAGTTWRGTIYLSGVSRVRLSMYGEGALPRLTNSDVRRDWKRDEARGLYYVETPLWLLLEDGIALRRLGALDAQATASLPCGSFGFTKASKRLYYAPSSGTPSDHLLEVPSAEWLINVSHSSQVEIDHLELYGFALHAIAAGGVRQSRFHDLIIHDGGGANDVFGNGIEISELSQECEVDSNRVYSIFDSGISPQYFHEHQTSPTIARICIHDNTVSRCGMDGIEVTAHTAYARLVDIEVTRNTVTFSGGGWSGDRGARGVLFNAGVRMGKTPDETLAQGTVRANAICGCKTGIAAVGHVRLLVRDNDIDGAGSGTGMLFHDPSATGEMRLEYNTFRNLERLHDIPSTNHGKWSYTGSVLSAVRSR